MPGNSAFKDSETAFWLPGRFTIRVLPLTPDRPRESMDNGVLFWP